MVGWEEVKKSHIYLQFVSEFRKWPSKTPVKCYWDSKVRVPWKKQPLRWLLKAEQFLL